MCLCMSDNDVTSVQVKTDTWNELNALKGPGDSMDDIINMLLETHQEMESEGNGGRVAAEG